MRFARGLCAVPIVVALLPAGTAHAADDCLTVTGAMQTPEWTLGLSPGLTLTPAVQSVVVYYASTGAFTMTCASTAGAVTVAGNATFAGSAGATGSSYTPEDLLSGSGLISGGSVVTDVLVTVAGSADAGGYTLNGLLWAGVSLSYVRTFSGIAAVTTLRDVTVDPDGAGPRPASHWGDVSVTQSTPVWMSPISTYSDVVYIPPSAGPLVGT